MALLSESGMSLGGSITSPLSHTEYWTRPLSPRMEGHLSVSEWHPGKYSSGVPTTLGLVLAVLWAVGISYALVWLGMGSIR